jgi:hypothetical protein
MLKHTTVRVIAASLIITAFAGCPSPRAWRYAADTYPTPRNPVLDKSIAVVPFDDTRTGTNSQGIRFALIPLVLFASNELSTPDSIPKMAAIWNFRPAEDLAKATAPELNNSHLFKEAFFTQRGSEGDLVLRGTIKTLRLDQTLIAYGLSDFGLLLWYLGLPAGTLHNAMEIEFTLQDNQTKKVIWAETYQASKDFTPFWVYQLHAHAIDTFYYDILFKSIMKDAVQALQAKVASLSQVQEHAVR